jgi:methionyl-tRNA formyltransferase
MRADSGSLHHDSQANGGRAVISSLSIVFAGTPEFSVPALRALIASSHRVIGVYTQPDRPAGRGRQLTASAVKECALEQQLAVFQPSTLRDPAQVEALAMLKPDVMVVVAYGLILPTAVLSVPRYGCLNIHASLLPRWRGAAPIHRAILAGDTCTGITIMQMDAGLDTGPMLLERQVDIATRETTASLHDRLSMLGAEAIVTALDQLAAGTLQARPQPSDGVTYASKIAKEEARIDWHQSAVQIDRQVRAFVPWPIAETRWRGEQLRIWLAEPLIDVTNASPGTVVATGSDAFAVATGAGVLRVLRVQQAGRKTVAAGEFARANDLQGAVMEA